MKFRWLASVVVAAGLIGFVAGSGFSEDEAPSEEEMMKVIMELATPGEHHAAMKPFIGEWDVVAKMWNAPGEPQVSKATATNSWFLGGRFLRMHYEGEFGGTKFTGAGLMGYDNWKKEYQGIWVDSMSSGMSISRGSGSEDGKRITLTSTWEGPWGNVPSRMSYIVGDENHFTIESYMTMGDDEAKHMELNFTRKAKSAPVVARPVARPVCRPNRGPGY